MPYEQGSCVHDAGVAHIELHRRGDSDLMNVREGQQGKGHAMSTNCIIAMQKENGGIEGIYCHWDGCLEGVGRILLGHYDIEKVRKLLSLGSISSLGEEIEPSEGAEHSYDDPFPGVTVAYRRDRGEKREPNFTAPSVAAFLLKVPCIECIYILKGDSWKVYLNNRNRGYNLESMLS